MQISKEQESGAKQKLRIAAEQLFAEKGFEAVSVRDITQRSKSNVAAVNYHFGSRDGLVASVLERCVAPVNADRIARLDKLEKKAPGKVVALDDLIGAFVYPLVHGVEKSELSENLYYRLLGRAFAQQVDGLPQQIEEQMQGVMRRFTRAFGRALPTVSEADMAWRIHFMVGGVVWLLMRQGGGSPVVQGKGQSEAIETALGRLVRFAVAGMGEGHELDAQAAKGPQVLFDF